MNLWIKIPRAFWWVVAAAFIVFMLSPVWASDDDDSDCRYDCDDSTTQAEADSNAEASAGAESSATGEGGAGGASTVTTRNESTSLVLTGARDTAPCFTKVTIGAEGFGIGFSRSDSYCKKVRRIAAHIVLENWGAAARLECTLKVWREVYGRDAELCFDDLFAGPNEPAPDLTGLYNQAAQTGDFIVAQVEQEEFEAAKQQAQEQHELVEYRVTQQQNKIDSLEQNEAELREQIERLREEAAAKAAADEARRIALGKALKNYGKENDT